MAKSPVNEVVDLEILIVLPERIQQRLCNLDPAHVAQELKDGKEWEKEVRCVVIKRVSQ